MNWLSLLLTPILTTIAFATPDDKPSVDVRQVNVVAAEAPTVKMPAEVRARPGRMALIPIETTGKALRWFSTAEDADIFREYDPDSARIRLRFVTDIPGRYKVFAIAAAGDLLSEVAYTVVIVGDPGPGPTPPIPPGPNPPTPPGPTPPPAPVPIPDPGLRVLVVYETADLKKYPPGQWAALHSQDLRNWLDEACVKRDGTPEWRIWDQNSDTTAETPLWQAAMKRPRASLPWILISNGKTGFEGPLPKTGKEVVELIARYRG